jgi:hypothetical protein
MKLTFDNHLSPSAKTIENLSLFIGRVRQEFADNIVATCGLVRLGFSDSRQDNRGQAQAKKADGTGSATAEDSRLDSQRSRFQY